MSKISVEQLMYMNYIKYDTMTEITNSVFSGSTADTVNVFIDLYSMIKVLYRSDISIDNYSSFTSSVINLCAHIRDFFRTRYNVHTKIFIIFSINCPESSKQFYMNYNKKMELAICNNKFVTDFIDSNIHLLKILCPYLYDIFFIDTKFEAGVAIYDLLMKMDVYDNFKKENVLLNHYPSIVFSKDIYLYQLPSLIPDLVIYRSYKKDGLDLSFPITNRNVISKYVESLRSKDRFGHLLLEFKPDILSLLISLTNLPDRGIRSVLNIATAIKLLYKGIESHLIYNGYNSDIKYISDILCTGKLSDQNLLLINRFRAIDIRFQHSIYINSTESKTIMDSIVNLYDPETIKLLNNKYFRSNPLDLNRL